MVSANCVALTHWILSVVLLQDITDLSRMPRLKQQVMLLAGRQSGSHYH